jgi:Kef-type K+ transport system membrane component KefB|tara:strand:+ start:37647 stop:38807 length:1161 start_codon:yes stop_codon:yes gene_type:complete
LELTHSFFLIFTGAAILASIAMCARQPLLVVYILLGAIIGPYGLGWIQDIVLMEQAAEIGIIFLLFLLGLDMQPSALFHVLKKSTAITGFSSIVFCGAGFGIAWLWGFPALEALVIGAAMMFSSTIIGIKLLPTTVLHHKHTGELMIGLLLLQDFLAIFVLLVLLSAETGSISYLALGKAVVALPIVCGIAYLLTRFVILKLITRFDRIQEFIFLLAIGWCLGIAELAHAFGLSLEIGAFIAGITLATSPIAQFIALSLKPLRDFFLVLFFFAVGAGFNLNLLPQIIIPALVLATSVLILKPLVFRFLVHKQSETDELAWDVGFRLGQISEFSLLIAFLGYDIGLLTEMGSMLIQATAIITFLASSYIVIFNYPNPLAVSDRLRRD